MFYRKTFTLPENAKDKKVFIEFEGLRMAADNRGAGNTSCNPPSENNNLRETKPGSPASAGNGSGFQWASMDFNPVQGGLNRNVNLYIKNTIYQTLPLYRNLRTQGTYVYPSEIDVAARTAVINVEADVSRQKHIGLDVILVDIDSKIAYQFGAVPHVLVITRGISK